MEIPVERLNSVYRDFIREDFKLRGLQAKVKIQRKKVNELEEKTRSKLTREKDGKLPLFVSPELCEEYGFCTGLTMSVQKNRETLSKKRLKELLLMTFQETFGSSNSEDKVKNLAEKVGQSIWDKLGCEERHRVKPQFPPVKKRKGSEDETSSEED